MKYQDLLQAQIIPSQIVPLVQKAGQNNVPVYIQGEQGVGKEWIAKMIHQLGEVEISSILQDRLQDAEGRRHSFSSSPLFSKRSATEPSQRPFF